MLYKKILKPILFRFDPESVHNLFVSFGEILGANPLTRALVGLTYGYHGRDISKTVDGIKYEIPIILSAGFDYNGRLTRILPHVGFGGDEIGSITARRCEGNKRPRMIRLPRSGSILVNKGLRNDGVDGVIARLKDRKQAKNFIIGFSIARTNDEKSAPVEAGIEDYAYSFRRLNEEGIGDYYSLNISCPNAFGGEAFTTPALLEKLLKRIKEIPCDKPIYAKMPINLPWTQFKALLEVIDAYGLNGIVIGNLNKDYNHLASSERPEKYKGGLSGTPCEELSNELIRRTRETYGRRFTVIGCGGIMSPEGAIRKLAAGADLLQLITGMIYEGPSLMKRMGRRIGEQSPCR